MNIQVDNCDITEVTLKGVCPKSNVCYKCGRVGHFQSICMYGNDDDDISNQSLTKYATPIQPIHP